MDTHENQSEIARFLQQWDEEVEHLICCKLCQRDGGPIPHKLGVPFS